MPAAPGAAPGCRERRRPPGGAAAPRGERGSPKPGPPAPGPRRGEEESPGVSSGPRFKPDAAKSTAGGPAAPAVSPSAASCRLYWCWRAAVAALPLRALEKDSGIAVSHTHICAAACLPPFLPLCSVSLEAPWIHQEWQAQMPSPVTSRGPPSFGKNSSPACWL